MFGELLLTGLSAHNKWLLSAQPYSYPPRPRKRAWKESASEGEEQCEPVSSEYNVAIIIRRHNCGYPRGGGTVGGESPGRRKASGGVKVG